MRSVALAVFGKAMTSRREDSPGQDHDDAVEAEGDAAVRRGAVLEGLEEEAEALLAPPRRRGRAA